MTYCQKCGKEVPKNAKFCPDCGATLTAVTPPKKEVVVLQKPSSSSSEVVGLVVVLIVALSVVFFAVTIQVFDCPVCDNNVWVKWACSYCGGDGKVTLAQLIGYSFRLTSIWLVNYQSTSHSFPRVSFRYPPVLT